MLCVFFSQWIVIHVDMIYSIKMRRVEQTKAEVFRDKACKFLLIIQAVRLPSAFNTSCFLLLTFLNLQTFEGGIDFCFDGSKKGRVWDVFHCGNMASCMRLARQKKNNSIWNFYLHISAVLSFAQLIQLKALSHHGIKPGNFDVTRGLIGSAKLKSQSNFA